MERGKQMSKNQEQSKFFQRFQVAPYLKDDVVNFIFNNLRNVGLSFLPLVAAKAYVKNPQGDSGVLVVLTVSVFAVVALLLLTLNIFHGWRKISELNISRWVMFPVAAFYGFAIALVWVLLVTAQP